MKIDKEARLSLVVNEKDKEQDMRTYAHLRQISRRVRVNQHVVWAGKKSIIFNQLICADIPSAL